MAVVNQNTPFGLSPIRRFDGASWNDSLRMYVIPAAQNNAIFVGDAITKLAAAAINGVPACDLTASGGAITGVVCGFLGFSPAGSGQTPSLLGLSGTPGNAYRPAAASQDCYVLVNDDPEAEFLIQENDNYGGVAATPLPTAAVGKNANLIHAAGSQVTGVTGTMLDANTVATTSTLQLSIKALQGQPAAVPGALYGKVIVTINNHTETPHQAGL